MDSSFIRFKARESLRNNWGIAVIAGIIASIFIDDRISSTLNFNFKTLRRNNVDINFESIANELLFGTLSAIFYIMLIVGVALFIVRGAVKLGYYQFNLDVVEYRQPQLGTIFSRFNMFGKAFLLELFTVIFTLLWALLLIIPGIIAAYSYSMAPYIMAENPDITPLEAIRKSKEMMYGHKLDLFVLHLSFIGWAFLCIFTCGIGALWLYPYQRASEAVFYTELRGELEI